MASPHNSILEQRDGQDRRDQRVQITTEWLKFLAGIVIAAILGYFATVNTVTTRISVLESKQQGQEDRLKRMEDKLDTLLARP